ncbi:MAG: 4Fe-4S dicluster domain-containing protein [Coriobacteriales bacterium]|nr:4Fe-4S dicluster domain-containing protein [Coriobacteriales bacterium]
MSKKYAIVVDKKRCIGCSSCAVACKLENNIPDQIWYKKVRTIGGMQPLTPAGVYGDCTMTFEPWSCNHCDNAPCVEVCPTGATFKDEETGIVMQDIETCIGCGSCLTACPYEGVRTLLEDEPMWRVDFPVGAVEAPAHIAGKVEKCNMCAHRIAKGDVPACVEGCPARAMFFGDLNDPESKVSELLATREYYVLQPEAGTNPNVYYLV